MEMHIAQLQNEVADLKNTVAKLMTFITEATKDNQQVNEKILNLMNTMVRNQGIIYRNIGGASGVVYGD